MMNQDVKIQKCLRCEQFCLEHEFQASSQVCNECFPVIKKRPTKHHIVCDYCGDRWITEHEFMCKMCLFSEQCINELRL